MSITKKSLLSLIAAIAFGCVSQVEAASLVWTSNDTRANGTVGVDPFNNGGANSLKFTTTSPGGVTNNSKASVVFHTPVPSVLGTLGDLDQFDLEFYLDAANTTPLNSGFAVRLLTNAVGTEALVWEGAYNTPNLSETKGSWVSASLDGQGFWQRAAGANWDQAINVKPLADWEAGFNPGSGVVLSPTTPIYGVQVSFGSGIAGDFTGYLSQMTVGFGSDVYTAAIPEPATMGMAAIAGVAGLALRRRARQA